MPEGNLRTCPNGHPYYKGSDCPACLVCKALKKPKDSFISALSAPARRALENAGINTLEQLSEWTERDLLKLHGMGKSSIPKLREALEEEGLKLRSRVD